MEEQSDVAPQAAHNVATPPNHASATPATSDAGDASAPHAALADGLTFTLTVGQAREIFAARHCKVPAERTLQHYCAEAIIAGQKIRTTEGAEWLINEPSLLTFIEKQPMISTAEAPQAAHNVATPPNHASATPATSDAGDAYFAQPIGEKRSIADVLIENAKLIAQVEGKDDIIVELKEDRQFLRDELREARKGRDDVKSIASRMLETLETMALGGKLLRSRGERDPGEADHRDIAPDRT